jgi:hypothetical protein
MHAYFVHRHFELFGRDLRENRVAALADFHCAGKHGDFASGIDDDARGGSGRRTRRFLNAREALANFNAGLRTGRFLAVVDRLRCFEQSFF